ncbi:MAG: MazG family protein, partial [Lentisphaerae bacterium]|nr:MazG family protein [Lentisphaerota bacterium]
HVFGDVKVSGSAHVLQNWEAIKAGERGGDGGSVVDGVPRHLPALQRAQRVQSRVSRVGFDWPDDTGPADKVDEELAETREAIASGDPARVREEMGDLLFAIVNWSRFQDVNAEEALRASVDKFSARFREVERRMRAKNRDLRDCALDELDECWEAVKKDEVSGVG